MATQSQYDAIPDVSEQTELDNGPIKIRWSGRDRSRVRRGLMAALEDDYIEKAIAYPVMTRQKTQIVIKTEEELEAFRSELNYKAKLHVCDRIEREIERQLADNDGADGDESSVSEAVQRRKEETDMDILLEEVIIPHAEKVVAENWPGGTVDVDEVAFFWNDHLHSCAARAYKSQSIPRSYVDWNYRLAIGLAPDYYYKHGLDEMLKVVRHELIHIWQFEHEMGKPTGGHGPDFKQWMDDLDTHRYCKQW